MQRYRTARWWKTSLGQAAVWAILCVLGLSATAAPPAKTDPKIPPPAPLPESAEPGAKIQRTMGLLATSTPEHRNRVRILFYGQSVTVGTWSKEVTDWLRHQYPNADLETENRAIGGFEASALIRTAEADLYPFYPDLMIFHVYSGVKTGELEEIVARTRKRTTAEILIRTPHFRWPKDLARDGSAETPAARGLNAADEEQSVKIREIAAKYGCELCDVRQRWRAYMAENAFFPKDLLADSVHLNPQGHHLMAALVKAHLVYRGKFDPSSWSKTIHDVLPGDPSLKTGADGTLELQFDGNRVDILPAPCPGEPVQAKVLLDGKAPSQCPGVMCFTRPSNAPGVWWPAIMRVEHREPLVAEKWTLRTIKSDVEAKQIEFEVTGSQTGADGSGTSDKPFASRSGRVVIEPKSWNVQFALKYRKLALPTGFQVTWEAKSQGLDVYDAPKAEQPDRQYLTTLVQGMPSGKHVLRLVPQGNRPIPIRALRVYRPSLAEGN